MKWKVVDTVNYFELYLDESGQFKEQSKNGRPSIVAGYLINKKCGEVWGEKILLKTKVKDASFAQVDTKKFHAMESKSEAISEFNVCLMEELQNNGATMVIFKNGRGNSIINSDITYLNVFAEGILKLMYHLLAHYAGEIFLNIIYATRVQVEEKEKSGINRPIEEDEYSSRLQERIILRMSHIPPNDRKRLKYALNWGSARKSSLLMLADAINYGFRGGISSLSKEQHERTKALKQLSFKVIEHSGWEQIQAYLTNNRWAESIYSWYGEYYEELQSQYSGEFNQLMIDKLNQLGLAGSKVQFEVLSNLIKSLIDTRNYDTANKFLERLVQKLFPLLLKEGLLPPEVDFDFHFFRLTSATHQGDLIEAEKQIEICRGKLMALPATWETMDYYLSYKLREAEHQKNMFDFQGAIDNLDKLERILRDTISVVKMIDDIGEFSEKIKSTTLGKVLGSRVTARCYLSYEKPEELELARMDSDAAIEQFHRESDKSRQYMIRSMVEYLAGNFEDALVWLGKAHCMEEVTPTMLLGELKKDKNTSVFGILHYTSLMALALKKDHPLGKKMFSAWNTVPPDDIIPDSRDYPTNIILWRVATCKAIMQPGAAAAYYKDAISSTDNNPQNLPNYMARIAMMAECMGLLSKENLVKARKKISTFHAEYEKLKRCWQDPLGLIINRIDEQLVCCKTSVGDTTEQKKLLAIVDSIPIL